MTPDEQIAAIRERHEQERQWSCEKHAEVSPGEPYSESGWCPMDMSLADVSALLNHIDALTAERDEANLRRAETVAMCDLLTAERNYLEQNETVVWEVLQLPDGSTIHDVAAAVFKLRQERDTLTAERDEANERRAETVAMCEQLTAERDRAEQMKAAMGVTLDFVNHDREKLTAELAAAERDRDRYNEEAKHAWGNVKIFQDELTKVQQELAAANARADGERANYEGVMDDVRGSLMKHGRCDSGKDYGGLPKACTACMAQIRLKDRVAKWKGRTIRVAGLVARGEHEKGGGDGS